MSFLGALQLTFVVLKLVGVIAWSWVVVLSPLLINFVWIIAGIAYVWFNNDLF